MARTGIPSQQIQDKSIESADLTSSLQLSGSTGISGSLNIEGPGISKDTTIGNREFSLVLENDLTASGIFGDFLEISSSVIQTSGSSIFGDDLGDKHEFTGSTQVSGNVSIDGSVTATEFQGITIGTPADGAYSDGFFDSFTSATTIATAIDEISEAFSDLAPSKAKNLTGTNLLEVTTLSNESAYLSNGLSGSWYVGKSAGNSITQLIESDNTFTLRSNPGSDTDSNVYRIGKNSDLSDGEYSGQGGVSASIAYGAGDFAVVAKRSFSEENGTSGDVGHPFGDGVSLTIANLNTYNTFWVAAESDIKFNSYSYVTTGSLKIKIQTDTAGESNAYQVWYVGNSGGVNNPTPSYNSNTVTTNSERYLRLSGVSHWGKDTKFDIAYNISNLFWPIYGKNIDDSLSQEVAQISSTDTIHSTLIKTQSSTPTYSDDLSVSETNVTLTDNRFTVNGNDGSTLFVCHKPTHTSVSSEVDFPTTADTTSNIIQTKRVNTYESPSTDGLSTTFMYEYFLDEDNRMGASDDFDNDSPGFSSDVPLTDGNLQCRNGWLMSGKASGDYSSFSTNQAEYHRRFAPGVGVSKQNLEFKFDSVGGFSSNSVSEYGSGDTPGIEIYIRIKGDSNIYDVGRAVGNNSGNIYGVQGGRSGWDFDVNLPTISGTPIVVTNSNPMILTIRFTLDMTDNQSTLDNYYIRTTSAVTSTSNYGIRLKFT